MKHLFGITPSLHNAQSCLKLAKDHSYFDEKDGNYKVEGGTWKAIVDFLEYEVKLRNEIRNFVEENNL